jgi:predicted ATPase/class 3 adenylate cyclase
MDFRILGPLDVVSDGQTLDLGGQKQRALLVLLLLNANRPVARERLVEALWEDEPPATAHKAVHVHVSHLRKLLGSGRLLRQAPGYSLRVDQGELDLERFEALRQEGKLREALALWRGPPLAEFAHQRFAQREIARLEELRLACLEERLEADLAEGRHADVVAELDSLVHEHPLRQRLRAQLMLALHRSGRDAEALESYQDVRRALVEELGIEPSRELRELQQAILRQDPALAVTAPQVGFPTGTVTLLFTGVEGSTAVPGRVGFEAYPAAAEDQQAMLRAVFGRHGGVVVDTAGDSLLAAFSTAPSAVAAALEVQAALVEGPTRVRIGIHTGTPHVTESGYAGIDVDRAARLAAAAHAGQILTSPATAALVDGNGLRDLGTHRFEDLAEPERVFQVGNGEFPQPRIDERRSVEPEASVPDVRKTVTVLFTDLVESTRLGRQLDPEALRGLLSRYFGEMQSVVERHGGTVEKFIGDAVMAVFGVPVLHEDDALRAVRAATEMRESLATLNQDLEEIWGVRLESRIGINSGEVVAGDHQQGYLFVTGEVVNAAKRLEEAAATSEILISEATHRLVRDAVVAERVGDRVVKGDETVDALRLVSVLARVPGHARRFDTPLVDREQQLSAIRNVFASVLQNRACHLLTVLGPAGIGKSRLVEEFVGEVGADATVLRGRCLPYGEGITYWPLTEVVREMVRTEESGDAEPSSAAIAELLPGEEKAVLIAELVSEALGIGGTGAGTGEATFWAVRKLFEALARRRPLVVVLDDLQWAEPTFIELVDYLAELSRDAPILLLCMARPEIFDRHPGWGGGKLNAAAMLLEPLDDGDCRRLIGNLLGRGPLPADAETRIAEAADGNPLFAEELLAMLVDEELLAWDDGRWVAADHLLDLPVPQTINTLLAARLEGLPDDERALLVRASVEGTYFHRSAIRELAPELPDASLESSLASLVRRDLIRPDRSIFAGDEGYRFRHLLIRDAAYRSLTKATRADLHERFASWLERTASDRLGEYEEIVGYHLEQAYRSRVDLGLADEKLKGLGARASRRLEAAGLRALARSDLHAAIGLLERAASLFPDDGAGKAELLSELGAALIEAGRLSEAERDLGEAMLVAAEAGDERAESRVLVQQQFLQLLHVTEGGTSDAARAVERVVPVFERCDDHLGLCSARRLEAWLHWNQARAAAAADAWERAAEHASRAGDDHARAEILSWIASSLWFGPTPVVAGIERCEEIRREVSGHLESEALTLRHLGGLHAMAGRFELARSLFATSNAVFEDLGLTLNAATSHNEAVAELLAGDAAAAETSLRSGFEALKEMGEQAFLSTTAAFLARAVFEQRRIDEAEDLAQLSAKLTASGDLLTQVLWRGVQARVLARRGRLEDAEALAREAVSLSAQTDFLVHRGDALVDLAHILVDSGRTADAAVAAAEGLHLYEKKGNLVAARKIRSDFDVLF